MHRAIPNLSFSLWLSKRPYSLCFSFSYNSNIYWRCTVLVLSNFDPYYYTVLHEPTVFFELELLFAM